MSRLTVLGAVAVAGAALAAPATAASPQPAKPASAAISGVAAPGSGAMAQNDRVVPGAKDSGYFYGGLALSGAAAVGGIIATRRREH